MTISLAAEKIVEIGPFAITNTMIVTWVVILLLGIFSIIVSSNLKNIPGKLQNFFEFIVEAILGMIEGVTGDRNKAIKFLPLVATLFLFILTANWISLIPGFETIGKYQNEHGELVFMPFLRSPNSDLNTTIALAIIAMTSIQVYGIKSLGLSYFKKFFNFKSPVDFFVGIIEIISELARIISFSFRLFGNVFAGGVLLIVVTYLIPFVVSIPFYGMEIFVGFVQALVFAMLTTVFLQLATVGHETHE
jgi:F-type H+-transporting ATPase subunit a